MNNNNEQINERHLISWQNQILNLILVFTGGVAFAASLAPFNLDFLAYIAMVPLIYFAIQSSWKKAALYGFIWGLGWGLFTFSFLREIDIAVPFLIAPVKAIWPLVFAMFLTFLWKYLIFSQQELKGGYEVRKDLISQGIPIKRQILFALAGTIFYVLIESTHSHLFPWNAIEVSAWKNKFLIQIVSITGSYAIAFIIVFINFGVFMLIKSPKRSIILPIGVLIFALLMLFGWYRIENFKSLKHNKTFEAVLIQGDISQRRNANYNLAKDALDIYYNLTIEALKKYPNTELIIWPESAVPMPYRSSGELGELFRRRVASLLSFGKHKMLIGALDYVQLDNEGKVFGNTNSALLLGPYGRIEQKYDKTHRVPFGEYIPFRQYLPDFFIKKIDMQRDLTPGVSYEPIIIDNGIKIGTAVCYEGIFSYINRKFSQKGANVLLVISNDAWYPTSSEPEQHLANALMRSVETGLYMIRCGNNGGSLVVSPIGEIEQVLEVAGNEEKHLRRGRGFSKVTVPINDNNQKTFFVKYGQWFIKLLIVIFSIILILALQNFLKIKLYLHKKISEIK